MKLNAIIFLFIFMIIIQGWMNFSNQNEYKNFKTNVGNEVDNKTYVEVNESIFTILLQFF